MNQCLQSNAKHLLCSNQGLQQQQQQQVADVCLLQCSGRRLTSHPGNIILEINRFLIGLQWGKDRHLQQQQQQQGWAVAGPRIDDDTNRSISSIEEDFITASEHLEDDSEEDNYRNGEFRNQTFFYSFSFKGSLTLILRMTHPYLD